MAISKPALFSQISGSVGSLEFALDAGSTVIKKSKTKCRHTTQPAIIARKENAIKLLYARPGTWWYETFLERWTTYARITPVKNRLGVLIYRPWIYHYLHHCHVTPAGELTDYNAPLSLPKAPLPTGLSVSITAPCSVSYTMYAPTTKTPGYYHHLYITPPTNKPHAHPNQLRRLIHQEVTDSYPYISTAAAKYGFTFLPGDTHTIHFTHSFLNYPVSQTITYNATVAAP